MNLLMFSQYFSCEQVHPMQLTVKQGTLNNERYYPAPHPPPHQPRSRKSKRKVGAVIPPCAITSTS